MSYAENFIQAYGQECVIERTPSVSAYVSMTLATKSYSDNRDLYRNGLISAKYNLASGEVITVGSEKFLIRSVIPDQHSKEIAFVASKANAIFIHKRFTETADDWGNLTQEWTTITDNVYSTAQIVSAALRQQDPGLLSTTKWVFLIPATTTIQELDRLQFKPDGDKCRVDSVDDIRLPGLLRVQCSDDRR